MMKFMHRHRSILSALALAAFIFSGAATPASAYYNPRLGRFMSQDPNGDAILVANALRSSAQNPVVLVQANHTLIYKDGMNFYQYVRSNPVIYTDPTGTFTYGDTLATAAIAGGLYCLADDYSHFRDEGSKWHLGFAFAKGAGFGTGAAMGFGWLTGAFASYSGISAGAAAASLGMMFAPPALGYSIYKLASAETMADQIMAQIDVGVSVIGVITPYAALLRGASPTSVSVLERAAKSALRTVGPGKGAVYGTRAHTAFRQEVNALGKGFTTEVSYYNRRVVRWGHPGSIRVDVVEGPVDRPLAIYDFKTGGSTLTPQRIQAMRAHLPKGYDDIPIVEVRGD